MQKDLELGKPSTEIKKVNLDKQRKEMKLLVDEISNLGAKLQEVKSAGVKLRSDKDFLLGAADKAEMNKKLEKLNDQNENLVKNHQSEAINKIKYREKMRKHYQPDLDQALKGIDTLVVKILDAERKLQEAIEQRTEKEKELKKVNARTAYSNDESERLNYKMKDCQLDPEIEKQYSQKSTPDIFSNLKEIVQERRSYTEQDKILFEDLQDCYKRHKNFETTLETNASSLTVFEEELDKCREEVNEINGKLYRNFQNQFENFFKKNFNH